jgi:hypothetical protein
VLEYEILLPSVIKEHYRARWFPEWIQILRKEGAGDRIGRPGKMTAEDNGVNGVNRRKLTWLGAPRSKKDGASGGFTVCDGQQLLKLREEIAGLRQELKLHKKCSECA